MRRAPGILAFSLAAALAGGAAHGATLELSGWPGPQRAAEAVVAPALRAPRDSSAVLAASLELTTELESDGWLDARVDAHWASSGQQLVVRVTPGERYHYRSLALDVPRADSAVFAVGLDWANGGPADPGAMTAAIERAVDGAEAQGYAWATLGVSRWAADSAHVDVSLTGSLGPRVTIDEVRIEGLKVTRPEIAEKAMGRLRGLPYNPASARVATQRLEQLGTFRKVDYLGLAGTGDWRRGVLRWRVDEPRYNTFEGAIGVQGTAGVVGLAKLGLGNLLGTARSVSLSWESRGPGLTTFDARYVEPMLFGHAIHWEAGLQQQIQDSTYTRFQWGTLARVGLGEREHVEAGFDDERVIEPHGDVRDADVQSTSFAIDREGRDDARVPRRGTRVRIEATQIYETRTLAPVPGAAPQMANATGSAVQLDGEWHRPFTRSSGLALETQAAGRFSSERILADWERYPLGGATTLRGHDEDEFHVDRFVLTRLEWRFFVGPPGERVALFWDHAQMETRLPLLAGGDALHDTNADGLGFGLRLPAAGGDVEVDYAVAPGLGFLDGRIHLRLVTAF